MTKQELIEILTLLSALEGWGFTESKRIPDFLLERLDKMITRVSEEVCK